MKRVKYLTTLLLLTFAYSASAQDWPQWRGPARDGQVQGSATPARLPKTLKQVWKVEVGKGHSSPVVLGERIYLFTREGEEEVARAIDLAGGKTLWRASYPAPYQMNSAAFSHGKGPKSTPVVSDGKLYTFGISGILSSWDTQTGKLLWRKNFTGEFRGTSPLFGVAMSPVVMDGLLIVHAGGHDDGALVALESATGKVRWKWTGDGPGYTSPIVVRLAGERQVVTQSQNYFLAVSLRSGKLLWKIPFSTPFDQNAVTPILYKDMLIYSGLGQPVTAVRVERENGRFETREIWRNAAHSMYMSSPVLEGDLLFGFSHKKRGHFFRLDAATGETRWQSEGRVGENAGILYNNQVVWALTDNAELLAFDINNSGTKYEVGDSPTWAHPVLLGKRILVKDKTTLACLKF